MSSSTPLPIAIRCLGTFDVSIGSAAGVALMGASRGLYTFTAHLRWTLVIALGYVASIATHLWLNANLFDGVPVP